MDAYNQELEDEVKNRMPKEIVDRTALANKQTMRKLRKEAEKWRVKG